MYYISEDLNPLLFYGNNYVVGIVDMNRPYRILQLINLIFQEKDFNT